MRNLLAPCCALLFACGGNQTPAEVAPPAQTDAGQPEVTAVVVPDASTVATASDASAPVSAPVPVQRCSIGAWDATKGCTATVPWSPPTAAQGDVATAVVAARKASGKEQLAAYRKAVATFDKLRATNRDGAMGSVADLAAEAEYALIVAHIATVMPDEAKKKCLAASVPELFGGTRPNGPPMPSKWMTVIAQTDTLSRELDGIAQKYPGSPWAAVAMTRSGVLFSHVRSSLSACELGKIALLTPEQSALIKKVRASERVELVEKATEMEQAVTAGFTEKRTRELTASSEPTTRRLMLGLALARAYGFSHDVITEGRKELSELNASLHDDTMKELLSRVNDPLDPEHKRTLAPFVPSYL